MTDDQAVAVAPVDPRLEELAAATQDHDPLADVVSENTRWLDATREPRYCWRCGKPLQDQQAQLPQGYNVLTGERLPDERHVTKVCPMHVTWVRQPDGSWARPGLLSVLPLHAEAR